MIIDIDGTLIPKSLERWFLKYLLQNHHTTRLRIAKNLLILLLKKPISKWFEFKVMYLRGFSEGVVHDWIRRCWQEYVKPKLFTGVAAMVRRFQEEGAHVVLLSGTLRQLAEPLSHYLQIDEIICAEPGVREGAYTGRLLLPHARGRNKVAYAEKILRRYQCEWSEVCVIADHWADRFLLERARHAVVVQPRGKIRDYALRRGWFVIDNAQNSAGIAAVSRKILASGD